MRLVYFIDGRLALVDMSATRTYSRNDVMALICTVLQTHELALDFSGEYVPVCVREELPLVAALVAAYHNSLVTANIEVCTVPAIPSCHMHCI